MFVRSGSTWIQQAYLKASNAEATDHFGGSVTISGDTIAVGASSENGGVPGVNVDEADNSKSRAGAVYVFVRNGSTWSQQAYVKASNPDVDDFFGEAVALDGDRLLVGAPFEDGGGAGINDPSEHTNGGTRAGARAPVPAHGR